MENKKYTKGAIKANFYARINALSAEFGAPQAVFLAVYEDDESLRFFRPSESWTGGNAEHTELMRQLAADASRDFAPIKFELKTIKTSDYWRWLATTNQNDTDGNRAQFISLQTSNG